MYTFEKKDIMTEKIDYHFVAVPYKLTYVCDALCLAVLTILIQKESYWREKGRLDANSYFYIANAEIESRIGYRRNVVNETIEGLFRAKMIDVIPSSSKRESNKYKINWDTILAYDKLSVEELNYPEMKVHKATRKETLTYIHSNLNTKNETNCTTTLNSLNNLNIINKDIINDSANCTPTELPNCYPSEFINNNNNEEEISNIFKCIALGGCYEYKDFFTDKEHAILKDILSEFRKESPNIKNICFELRCWSNELSKEETRNAVLAVITKLEKAYKEVTNKI